MNAETQKTAAVGMVGRKIGMTRVFQADGASVPVTVLEVPKSAIVQLKTIGNDGYTAVQLAYGEQSLHRINRPVRGHYRKAEVPPARALMEFRAQPEQVANCAVGDYWDVSQFDGVAFVDVSGITKGKGFAGTVKRWHFSMQDATHGNSLSHRVPGSIGQRQTPGRVFKGKKMAGQLGNVQRTVQSLQVVRVDAEKGLLLIKGACPGPAGGWLAIRPAVKKTGALASNQVNAD